MEGSKLPGAVLTAGPTHSGAGQAAGEQKRQCPHPPVVPPGASLQVSQMVQKAQVPGRWQSQVMSAALEASAAAVVAAAGAAATAARTQAASTPMPTAMLLMDG